VSAINKILFPLFVLLSLVTVKGYAQTDEEVKDYRAGQLKSFARNAMLQGDYSTAAMYLESYCIKKPSNYKATYKLAECYRLSKDFRKAEDAYLKAYNLNPKKNSLALFHYATMLKITGRYKKADEYYAKFKKEYKGKDKSAYLKLIKNNLKAAEYVENVINNPVKAAITHLDSTINTGHVEAAPVFVNDSTLIYSSLKTQQKFYHYNPEDSSSNEPHRKLYMATLANERWSTSSEMNGPFNDDNFHISNGVFSADGKEFYFTKCKRNNKNRVICAIYVSSQEDGNWSEPMSLGNSVNDPKFTATQPAIGIDLLKNREIIYFVSDRDGGKGGMDIWYTTMDPKKKTYKAPLNAGAKLNTAGDEVTPFFDWTTRTLYFSSDGWQGIGGLDVFKSFGEYKKWTTPENLGAPLNSSYDDLYYTLAPNKKENGMLVSNRGTTGLLGVTKNPSAEAIDTSTASVKENRFTSEGCCDDLYSVLWLDAMNLAVTGKLTEAPDSGIVTDPVPLKGAKVLLEQKNSTDTSYVAVNGIFTDEKGNYSIALMPDREYRLITKKDGYLNTVYEFNTRDRRKSENINVDLAVKPSPYDAIPLQNIYYEYGKATLTQAAMEAIDTTLLLILSNNPELVVELSSHTDNIGSDQANNSLSQKRAESVVKYLISKGINEKSLVAKGYGESKPIADNQNGDGSDNPENRQKNRRTEFKIVGKLMDDGRVRERTTF
jgi:OmpA-OmpF porin, OOP family